MYYSVKLQYMVPKEGGDEMQKKSESFLVFAESCTEAEGRMSQWIPANYQDPEVLDVKKTNIGELRLAGGSETFWNVKIMDDLDGTSEKPKPYIIIYDGDHLEEAVRKCAKDFSSEMESITRFKVIVDEDLINQTTVTIKRKVVVAPVSDDDIDAEVEDLPEDDS